MASATDLAQLDGDELATRLGDSRRELFNLRFQLATGQLDNSTRINKVRKDVARMMTELRIREIAEAEGMAMEDLPAHQAAARRRSEDEALGRSRTTASERRAAAKLAEEADGDDDDDIEPIDEDELAEEVADDDGMALPEDADDLDDSEEES
jgi:large subunit ribosomal protein L29